MGNKETDYSGFLLMLEEMNEWATALLGQSENPHQTKLS
jgi:hypothetical protein